MRRRSRHRGAPVMAEAVSIALLNRARRLIAENARLTDSELLERFARHRDEAAFEALVRRYSPLVQAACRRVPGAAPDTDDVVQATFLLLAKKAGGGLWRDCIAGWLHK